MNAVLRLSTTGWRAVAVALAGVVVALSVGLGFALQADQEGGTRGTGTQGSAATLLAAQADAEKAARAAAINLTTYDYRTLDTDFDWVVVAGTEAFRARYAEVSAPTKRYVAEFKVRAEGSVDQAAATAQDADHVTVLLFVDQTLTTAAGSERQLANPRVRMQMVRSGGRWLVDDVAVRNLVAQ
ncbi:MAG: hypothetical protein NTV23_05625 [Propionibacteriales bacterium]|nr:hypothetical protein [Propionibacteriales bacterium]